MAKKIHMKLGALQDLIDLHVVALGSKNVEAPDANGQNPVVVRKQTKDAAVKALTDASKSLSVVCQQGVLAIDYDPD